MFLQKLSPAPLIIWWYLRFVIWGYLVIPESKHDRVCYGGIGHRRVSGELEGAYNSRHAYQQLEKRACHCQPITLCFESSAVAMPVSSDINHLTKNMDTWTFWYVEAIPNSLPQQRLQAYSENYVEWIVSWPWNESWIADIKFLPCLVWPLLTKLVFQN